MKTCVFWFLFDSRMTKWQLEHRRKKANWFKMTEHLFFAEATALSTYH